MTVHLRKPGPRDVPIHLVTRETLRDRLAASSAHLRRWLQATGFDASPHSHALVPGEDGSLQAVWAGVGEVDDPWLLAALPTALPEGSYTLSREGLAADGEAAALSWSLGSYRFTRYKKDAPTLPALSLPSDGGARRGLMIASAVSLARDLINTPAEDMGPDELARAVRSLGKVHGAKVQVTVGDALLKRGFPSIHAVGRAAAKAPRLIELTWGSPKHPRLTLVGKGVCFDSGGLDIKPSAGMLLMKKDMGGAANALALAKMVMSLELPVRLQLLIPAVENAIAGNAFRPGDVIRTRAGLAIEIGNTDAEGRVILCDALAYGAESKPALMIDLATLTGAARTALGPDLPALFCRDTALARTLVDLGLSIRDPLWHMPLWAPYHKDIESPVGDIVNSGRTAMAGAVTAALFLQDFVPADMPWLHVDLYAWNGQARPGRPVGGEAQTLRTLLQYVAQRFGNPGTGIA